MQNNIISSQGMYSASLHIYICTKFIILHTERYGYLAQLQGANQREFTGFIM